MASMRDMVVDAFYSLGRNINKAKGDTSQETTEGVIGSLLPELTLDMNNEDLVKLSDIWLKSWNDSAVKSTWQSAGEENEKYWMGNHFNRPEKESSRPLKDNAIFEGLETYLPQVTRRNPEAMVSLSVTEAQSAENQLFIHALQLKLGELADDLKLRLKLKGAARHWSIYLLGALKPSWDLDRNIPDIKVIRPTKLILDPDATVDEDGYTGERIGEHRKLQASILIDLIKGQLDSEANVVYIKDLVKDDLATEVGFIEWWTNDYMFWKLDTKILKKYKNPHWNYDEQEKPEKGEIPDTGNVTEGNTETPESNEQTDEQSDNLPPLPQLPNTPNTRPSGPRKGVNHLRSRKMPYLLLSIYNLGKQPVDVTSLIGQNLANQDLINKRLRQIDKNADTTNNGMVVSLERSGLTKDEAAGVTSALRNGGVVAIPAGTPQEAVWKPPMYELPAYIYNSVIDTRNRVRDIWGTRGSSPAGQDSEQTVRGKILNRTADTDRIGGGINEFLEQLADDAYNYLVQLLYVYDDEFVKAISQGIPIPKINVSVKEGSLLPKDSTSIANQAMTLASEGKMSLLDLYKALDDPNPEEKAANAWLEVNAPEVLFESDERIQKVIQARQQAQQGAGNVPPKESINFKDLPPEGKAQMAAQAGIQLHPEGIAAHDTVSNQSNAVPLAQAGAPPG